MSSQKYITIAISLIILSGCARYSVNSADDIKVDEDRNIVFMGYDFTIPDTRIKSIRIMCSYKNIENKTKNGTCFYISGEKGKTTYKGAETMKLKFGKYKIRYIEYTIVTGRQTITSKGYSSTSDITRDVVIMPNAEIKFNVSRASSPYIGRFYIDVDHGTIGTYLKKKKRNIWAKNKLKLTGLSRHLKLKVAQKYSEDILHEKFYLRKALDSHINNPSDKRNVNDTYKNNINCIVEEGLFRYKSSCKVDIVKEASRGTLSKEYSFSFSTSRH